MSEVRFYLNHKGLHKNVNERNFKEVYLPNNLFKATKILELIFSEEEGSELWIFYEGPRIFFYKLIDKLRYYNLNVSGAFFTN